MNLQIGDDTQDKRNADFYNFASSRIEKARMQNLELESKKVTVKEKPTTDHYIISFYIVMIIWAILGSCGN